MSQKKKTKLNKKSKETKAAKNKKAFDEIIGDPFAYPESIDGHYMMQKSRSSIMVIESEPKSKCPVNGAKPTSIDFLCDVEAAVINGLKTFIQNCNFPNDLALTRHIFDNTYLLGTGDIFNQQERAKLEQIIGNILLERGISPVQKYFRVIKQ